MEGGETVTFHTVDFSIYFKFSFIKNDDNSLYNVITEKKGLVLQLLLSVLRFIRYADILRL